MTMLKEPWKKYKPFKAPKLPNRTWPDKTIEKAPRWLSSCLRDGNQSLPDPMNGEEKWRYFKMLCDLGYKEIEVSFPSASQTDFDFTQRLIQTPGAVPDDVFLQVLSPCRPDLIRRTVESVRGAKNAIIHIYLATSACFRQVVFGYTEEQTLELAVECTKLVRSLTKDNPEASGTNWQFEFSPECFSDTDPDYAVRVCQAVKAAWGPDATKGDQIILNLPATVELATPNIYADLIEYFCNNIGDRQDVCISLHPHNDRGCSIAAAELAQMAGADRVEGCLFGNGERTGNVDLVTLALNLYTQGVSPNIDFSDLNSVIDMVESCTKIPVHQRAPYGGSLVCAAFSGSHQDAIKKGFQDRKAKGLGHEDPWNGMPYLPLDPRDIGRNYEAIIRVNSQSGKGGSAFIVHTKLQLDLPRGLQVAFSKVVQKKSEEVGRELLANEITSLFENTYFLNNNPHFSLVDYSITPDRSRSPAPAAHGRTQDTKDFIRIFEGVLLVNGKELKLRGRGNGPISSMVSALKELNIEFDVNDYKEHAIGEGRGVKAASYIECKPVGSKQSVWGVGIHEDVVQSSLIALLSAASNFVTSRPASPTQKPTDAPAPQETPSVVSILEEKANGILLTLASFAAASPFRRQQTVTGTIKSSVDTVSSSSLVTLNEIDNNVALIKNNVDAQLIVQAQALVKANYQAIAQGLAASTTTIVSVTTGAAGGVAGQAIGLTNQQIATLTASILIVIDIIENIGATVTVTVTDLTPALRATFQAEINAVKAAVNPFVSPVLLFAAAVRAANVGGSATITGLDNAIVNLLRVQSEVAASIGIPPLSL
ncbi:probable 2-isopropylmalalate synthase [Fusarium fujikuroi]|nr:probable 2-isopropylmalalate synthase [Fusarium fujikuroi]